MGFTVFQDYDPLPMILTNRDPCIVRIPVRAKLSCLPAEINFSREFHRVGPVQRIDSIESERKRFGVSVLDNWVARSY